MGPVMPVLECSESVMGITAREQQLMSPLISSQNCKIGYCLIAMQVNYTSKCSTFVTG